MVSFPGQEYIKLKTTLGNNSGQQTGEIKDKIPKREENPFQFLMGLAALLSILAQAYKQIQL